MINNSMYQRMLTSVLTIFIAMMFSFTTEAASCKGKAYSSCSADSDCSWVSGYKRQDGAKVSSHCRATPGKATKQKTKKKTKAKKTKKDKKAKKTIKSKKDKKNKKTKTPKKPKKSIKGKSKK